MDIWLDQQNPLTLSPDALKAHFDEVEKSKKRRNKRNALQPQNCNVITARTENNND